jgi:hypothetical protein
MRLASTVLAFVAAFSLAACQSGTVAPTVSQATATLRTAAKGHPTFEVTKHAGGLLATLTTNDANANVDYDWVAVGCGPKNKEPCYTFAAAEGVNQVSAGASAPGCKAKGGSVTCPTKGFSSVGIVSDANGGGGGGVTLQGGTGPRHPAECTSVPVSVTMKGLGNANTWDGCRMQTITCTSSLEEVIANKFDDIKGTCGYVKRNPNTSTE